MTDRPSPLSEPSAERTGPQFTLRTLLWTVTCAALLMAVMHRIGPVWSMAIFWSALLVLGHVAGNAWKKWGRPTPAAVDAPPRAAARPIPRQRPSLLAETSRLGWRMRLAVAAGVVLGAAVGVGLMASLWRQAPGLGWGGAALGVVSTSVLGGLLGFVTGTFLGVFLKAWRQAARGVSGSAQRDAS